MAASEFLLSKWQHWYKTLDVNHDGVISDADAEESKKKFAELHHFESEERKTVTEMIDKWWKDYIFRGRAGEITQAQFVDQVKKDFEADKAKFKEQISNCFNTVFRAIDSNHDNFISEDEFIIAWQAFGHENVEQLKKSFADFKPENGMVPFKTVVDEWIDFITCEDSSKGKVLAHGFELGIDS